MGQYLSIILTFIAISTNLIGIGIFVGSNNEFKKYIEKEIKELKEKQDKDLEELKKKQDKYNNYLERLIIVEQVAKKANERIDNLET